MVKATLFTSIAAATLCVVSAKTYHTKVAILGGGVSGISALLNLTDAGIDDFMVIEARDELGGRAQIAPFAGVNVELGCNWVQGLGSNPVNQLALKYNLSTVHDDGDDVVFYDENGKLNNTDVYDHFNDVYDDMSDLAFKRVKKNQVDLSGRAALDMVGWNAESPIELAVENYVYDWEMGEAPELSSAVFTAINDNWTYTNFGPDSDGDNYVVDQRGFKTIFQQESQRALKKNDKRVLLNHTITNVKYDDHGVTIVTKNGDIVKAEYAISTFSVGVMQNHDIKWTPKLPDWKKEGFFGFHMATYTKIFLNFPKQFWDNNQYTVWADPDRRGYMSVWQNLNAPGFFPKGTSTNIFFVTLTQDWSYAAESMTDKEVQDEMMVVLKKMYGDDIPEPTEIMFPRWHSNPLFRGSYSNWPIGELDQHHVNMKAPIKNRLFFAGEALSTEYYGFLQGAWFTGAEAADSIAKCIDDKCPETEYYPIITLGSEKPSLVRRAFL